MEGRRERAWLLLLLVAPAPSIGAAAAFHWMPGAAGNLVYTLCKLVLYGLPVLWWLRLNRPPVPMPWPRLGSLGMGLLTGLALGGIILALYALVARGWIDPEALAARARASGFDTRDRYLVLAAYLVLMNAPLEEYAFRWFIYGRCRALVGAPAGAVLGALIFTAHHVIVLRAFFDWPMTLLTSAGVFIGGLVWTWLYERYAMIWPACVSHAITDVAVLAIGWNLLF